MIYDKEGYESGEVDFKKQVDDEHISLGASTLINGVQALCHGLACQSGWWTNVDETDLNVRLTKIALIHTELSEAVEGARKGLMDDHLPHRKMEEVELADAVIRIFDYAETQGYSLGDAMMEKLKYNQQREDHKPENRAKAGGKKV
jgi:NTP pyrophosphatase (non-canonical NTP hydrolase)